MMLASGLALSVLLAQAPSSPTPPEAGDAMPRPADSNAVWLGGEVPVCPEDHEVTSQLLRLTEVPETPFEKADVRLPENPPAAKRLTAPAPCISPAGR